MKSLLYQISCLLMALFLYPSSQAQSDPDASEPDIFGLDSLVNAQLANKHIPSIAVGVVKDGRVIIAEGYGLADLEARKEAHANTIYQIGSVTKMFTGHVL